MHVDEELRAQIGDISRAVAARLRRPYADFEDGVRKQATLPEGAVSLGLAGTAPGLVLRARDAVVVVLPGPPAELQRLWPRALETDAVRDVLARTEPRGAPRAALLRRERVGGRARADRGGRRASGVVATICARDFEIHVDLYGPSDGLAQAFRDRLERHLFAEDERGVEEIVLDLCRARGWTLATAESCTGGLAAARLTSVPGSSDVFVGSIVSYANEVKERELGVPHDDARAVRRRVAPRRPRRWPRACVRACARTSVFP